MKTIQSNIADSERPWGRDLRLLVVDDEKFIRTLVRERMELEGFLVEEAENGRQALAKLGMAAFSVLLTDIRMPEMDGIALLHEASHRYPDMARIVMTAYAELDTAVAAMKGGAFDCILKPLRFDALFAKIRSALHDREMERRLHDHKATLETRGREQTELINQVYVRSIHALIKALEAKDFYTRGHSQRVTRYSVAIGREMGMSPDHLKELRRAAILHDLGKIGVREAILNKPGRLTDEEIGEVLRHPETATRILSPIPFFRKLLPSILHHHERYDGLGYPKRLKGSEIPLDSRIMAVCDAYDAMTSDRAYRAALPAEYAAAEILRCSGTQFDPEIVSVFLSGKDTIAARADLFAGEWQEEEFSSEEPSLREESF